ncbi:hypothetical protein HPB51_019294 [Rhipicephalus microplus]|uniref:Uncharacterized protein n=1 Tax=Rhipicephalus microplus TaxID=6941 RepID=A0A9J6EUA1_RHIMP|nr:hypothetical protein HPB51_019294 [Rhipicephalus microplus]
MRAVEVTRRRARGHALAFAFWARAARPARALTVPYLSTLGIGLLGANAAGALSPLLRGFCKLELCDMSTTGARRRERSRRPKPTFGSSSRATRNLPHNMQATLEELFADLTLQRGSSEPEWRRCVQEEGNAPEPPVYRRRSKWDHPRTSDKAPSETPEHLRPSNATKSSARNDCGTNAPKVFESGTIFMDEAERNAGQNPTGAISATNASCPLRQIREILQENGPTREDDLLKALGPSLTRVIFEEHSTLTAFLGQHPGFQVVRKDLYTFVCYKGPEENGTRGRSSLAEPRAIKASCEETPVRRSGRRQPVGVGDSLSRSVSSNSSSSDPYESAVDGEEERERRRCPLKNRFTKVPTRSRPSRSRRVVKQMRDAVVQTQGSYPNTVAELEYTLQKRKAEITELHEALKALKQSQARELQQLRTSISKLLKRPPPTLPWSVTSAPKSRIGGNERKPIAEAGACTQDSLLPLPWAMRPRYLPLRRKPEKQNAGAFNPTPEPLPLVDTEPRMPRLPPLPVFPVIPGPLHYSGATIDNQFRRSAMQSPEFPKLPSHNPRPRHRVTSVDRKSRRSLTRPPIEEFLELPGRDRSQWSGPRFHKPKRSAQQLPEQQFFESPGRQTSASVPDPEFQSVTSRPGGYATGSRTEQQASARARKASQECFRNTEKEDRCQTNNSRRGHNEFSRMNFNAIVALMLGHAESTSQAKP